MTLCCPAPSCYYALCDYFWLQFDTMKWMRMLSIFKCESTKITILIGFSIKTRAIVSPETHDNKYINRTAKQTTENDELNWKRWARALVSLHHKEIEKHFIMIFSFALHVFCQALNGSLLFWIKKKRIGKDAIIMNSIRFRRHNSTVIVYNVIIAIHAIAKPGLTMPAKAHQVTSINVVLIVSCCCNTYTIHTHRCSQCRPAIDCYLKISLLMLPLPFFTHSLLERMEKWA